jgi:hypothetical protein
MVVGQAPASARAPAGSLEGTCSLQGTVTFTPPATNSQRSLSSTYEASGTCTGTLNGRTISNAPVTVRNADHDVDGSCLHADTTKPGHGAFTFADGTTIRFTSEFHFVGTNGTFTIHGQRSGSAHATGSFLTQRTPPDLAMQCAGDGVSEAPMDLSMVTESPLVSGGGDPAESARSGNGGTGPSRLHLATSRSRHRRRPGGHGASTFRGSCQVSGPVVFEPPLTNDPQPTKQHIRARGECSGTFVDSRARKHRLSDAPATYSESSEADEASCAAGEAAGHGALRFDYGKIRFGFSEVRGAAGTIFSLTGGDSGSAHGVAAVSESEDPAGIAQRCGGSGLDRVMVDVRLMATPSISG